MTWDEVAKQPQSLPGQRLLFSSDDDEMVGKLRANYVDQDGQLYLADFGHGLPGVRERAQRLLWDI